MQTFPLLTREHKKQFQFPSNGKAQRKTDELAIRVHQRSFVSIPFKRESTAKVYGQDLELSEILVSIPFKRESTAKDDRKPSPIMNIASSSFNSLQTGKHSERYQKDSHAFCHPLQFCFNSLQTGKHSERKGRSALAVKLLKVSIPFKRESTAKA